MHAIIITAPFFISVQRWQHSSRHGNKMLAEEYMWSAHTNTCYFALVMLFQCVRKVDSHSYKCGRLGNDFDSFIAGSTYVIYRSILSNY